MPPSRLLPHSCWDSCSIHHFDFYRLRGPNALRSAGWDQALQEGALKSPPPHFTIFPPSAPLMTRAGLCIAEWAERLADGQIPSHALKVRITDIGGTEGDLEDFDAPRLRSVDFTGEDSVWKERFDHSGVA